MPIWVTYLASPGLSVLVATAVATLLPISAIVATLAVLNLEHVMFDIMAGIREDAASSSDTAYSIVFMLGIFAYMSFPVTLFCYLIAIIRCRNKKDTAPV